MLQVSIDHVHSLIGTDIAYISIYNEVTRVNAVRASVGTISQNFGTLAVPYGVGIGGIIAATLDPFISTDYLADPAISHLDVVDEGMSNEGIRAVAAVPVVVRGRVIGGLYAADRTPREFTHDEIEVLSAFAALAAVAIENARLFEENAAALANVSAAYQSLTARNEGAQEVEEQHSRIVALGLADGSLMSSVNELARILKRPIMAVDEFGMSVAHSPHPSFDESLPLSLGPMYSALRTAERNSNVETISLADGVSAVCMPLKAGGDLLGALLAITAVALRGHEARAFENAAQLVSNLMLQRRVSHEQARVSRNVAFARALELAATAKPPDAIEYPGRDEANVRLDRVAAFAISPRSPATTAAAGEWTSVASRFIFASGGASQSRRDGTLVGVLPPAELPRLAAMQHGFSLGARPAELSILAVTDLPARQLPSALSYLNEYARSRSALTAVDQYRELSLPDLTGFLLPLSSDPERLAVYVTTTLGPLAEPGEAPARLRETLASYLDLGRNARKVSEFLGIHYKTVQQRLDRASLLLGIDLTDSDAVLRVQLALRIARDNVPAPE